MEIILETIKKELAHRHPSKVVSEEEALKFLV
jgi:hypothetical protein